jgi:hypothetical protein
MIARRFSTRLFVAVGVGVSICAACFSGAQTPSSQPTTEAVAIAPDAPMRKWFDRLAADDPKERDKAAVELMGLTADDLPKLRQLIIEHQPIKPAQVAALHDIVIQAFLSNDPYETVKDTDPTQAPYFIGLLWQNSFLGEEDARLGVMVDQRLPGFPSYRYLRSGDMILGVFIDPTVSLLQFPNRPTHTHKDLTDAIGSNRSVQDIVLLVLRDGEQIRVPLKMAPRPAMALAEMPGEEHPFLADRAHRADAYWEENFVPLLEQRDAAAIAE